MEQAKEFLRSAPEISIFGICAVMVDELRGFERAFKSGQLTTKAFWEKSTVVVAQLCETATTTERFGLVLPVIGPGEFSPFFWRWFNWWDDYFQTLTPAQVNELEAMARERKPETVSSMRSVRNVLRVSLSKIRRRAFAPHNRAVVLIAVHVRPLPR